jgi:hypothetical protein
MVRTEQRIEEEATESYKGKNAKRTYMAGNFPPYASLSMWTRSTAQR